MSKSALPAPKKAATKAHPTHEEIALRAYEIYLERGGMPGNELENWTLAERQLLEQRQKPRRKLNPKSKVA